MKPGNRRILFVEVAARRGSSGATLSEILIALLIFAVTSLALLGMVLQAAKLDAQEEELTQATALAQGLVEERLEAARDYQAFQDLKDQALTPGPEEGFLWEFQVREEVAGIKKLSVSLYHADPDDPSKPDLSRPRRGEAMTVSAVVREPNP